MYKLKKHRAPKVFFERVRKMTNGSRLSAATLSYLSHREFEIQAKLSYLCAPLEALFCWRVATESRFSFTKPPGTLLDFIRLARVSQGRSHPNS